MTEHHSSLGATFDPLSIQFELPYAFYARLRQEEPVTFSPAVNAYQVSRYDDIQSILAQPDLFSSKDVLLNSGASQFYPETIAELSAFPTCDSCLISNSSMAFVTLVMDTSVSIYNVIFINLKQSHTVAADRGRTGQAPSGPIRPLSLRAHLRFEIVSL